MNGRRVEREERRQPHVELNLASDAKVRSAAASKGCLSMIKRIFTGAVFLMILGLGLGLKI
jgi:hypothetical protein